jgi:hypothetical protein
MTIKNSNNKRTVYGRKASPCCVRTKCSSTTLLSHWKSETKKSGIV